MQLCEGLPYRFALEACVGREKLVAGEKEVEPFRTPQEVEAWIKAVGPKFGFKPDFFNVDDQRIAVSVRRPHGQVAVCVDRRRAAGYRRGPDQAAAVARHRFVSQSRLGIAAAIQLVATQHLKDGAAGAVFHCSRPSRLAIAKLMPCTIEMKLLIAVKAVGVGGDALLRLPHHMR